MRSMWGRNYLALAAIGFGALGAFIGLGGYSVFVFEAVVVVLLMTIGLVGEDRSQGRKSRQSH